MDKTYSSQAITSIYTFTSGMALETKLEATPDPLGETNNATESFCFQTQQQTSHKKTKPVFASKQHHFRIQQTKKGW